MQGGRSTHGICFGVLSWLVREGHADGVDLSGLAAAFTIRYDDDEPGSPWSFVVHVDERGSEEQREALAAILTGRLGGDDVMRLPWVRKPSEELAVHASAIELSSTAPTATVSASGRRSSSPRRGRTRPTSASACVIPGHHVAGTEYYADRLAVRDDAVRLGARGELRVRLDLLVRGLMPNSTVCLSFDFDAHVGLARVRPRRRRRCSTAASTARGSACRGSSSCSTGTS